MLSPEELASNADWKGEEERFWREVETVLEPRQQRDNVEQGGWVVPAHRWINTWVPALHHTLSGCRLKFL